MISSSSGLELKVILGLEPQDPVWCPAGIKLFVHLEVDPVDSPRVYTLSPIATLEGRSKESKIPSRDILDDGEAPTEDLAHKLPHHNLKENEEVEERYRRDYHGDGSGPRSDNSDPQTGSVVSFIDLVESSPDLGKKGPVVRFGNKPSVVVPSRRFEDGFGRSVVVELCEPRSSAENQDLYVEHRFNQLEEHSNSFVQPVVQVQPIALDDVLKSRKVGQLEESPCPAQNENLEIHLNKGPEDQFSWDKCDPQSTSEVLPMGSEGAYEVPELRLGKSGYQLHDADWDGCWGLDPENQPSMSKEFYSCSKNCSWTPELGDSSWTVMDRNSVEQVVLVGANPARENPQGELERCYMLLSSLSCSDNEIVGPRRLYNDVNPGTFSSPDSFPDVEGFSVRDVSAALQLLELRNCDRNEAVSEVHEKRLFQKSDSISSLGLGGGCGLKGLSTIVKKISAALTELETRNRSAGVQSDGVTGLCWSEGDVPIDDVNGAWKCCMRRMKPNKRRTEDFRRSQIDEPCKRKYKSMKNFGLVG